jgi:hypothetical protein
MRHNGTWDVAWHTSTGTWGSDVVIKGYNPDGTVRYAENRAMPAHQAGTDWWDSWPANERQMPEIAVYNNNVAADGAQIHCIDAQHKSYNGKVEKAGAVVYNDNIDLHPGDYWQWFSNWDWQYIHPRNRAVAVADSGHAILFGGKGDVTNPNTQRAMYYEYDDNGNNPSTGVYYNEHGVFSDGMAAWTAPTANGQLGLGYDWITQWRCDTDMNSDGKGVFVWVTDDAGDLNIAHRRYHLSAGTSTLVFDDAAQQVTNTITANHQFAPRVSMDEQGRFAVVWMDLDFDIWIRCFNADGTALAETKVIDSDPSQNPDVLAFTPDVAVDVNDASPAEMDWIISYALSQTFTTDPWTGNVLMGVSGTCIPEPATLALLSLGLGALLARRRR